MPNSRATEILLVDDEEGMLEVYVEILRRGLAHARLDPVAKSVEAAQTLKARGYDLLLTNLNMPGLNGMRLLRLAKERRPNMPVLVVTGYPMRETVLEARRLGAADYVTKPFDPDDLLARIRAILAGPSLNA